MSIQIPLSIEAELMNLGVLDNNQIDEALIEEPVERNYEFRWPIFDENGEPDF